MQNKKKFYITTAIAYASSKPHIGNAYDIVLADMIARYKKMMGFDVYLMTGSDEHGQKIEEKANAAGITPKEYVDNSAAVIKSVWDSLNTNYDKFIRTTDDYHEKTVQKIFKKLYDQGDIYKSEYQGKYCVPCESFYTESQLVDGKCPDCGREVIDSKEEAYFLKLSKYQDKLLEYYEQNPDFIKPESRKNEMINNFLKPGLSDLCVSRSSFKWGVPVEFDDKHVIYVWIDALSNYITGIGYDAEENSELYRKLWPADLHVIGKDIVRFHTIYWPIILMALGLPLPKQVLGHPWVLVGEDKMSKSKGNVVYADELAKRFGIDAVRYYLLSEVSFSQDGTFTYENFINKFNTDLANTLGNLVNRSVAMTNKYFGGKVSFGEIAQECDKELICEANKTIEKYKNLMDIYHNAEAIETVMNLAKRCNKYIDETTPWSLAKDEANRNRLNTVLYNLLECIRLLSIMLSPVMPQSCDSIKKQLCTENTELSFGAVREYSVETATPLFARLDAEKVLAELNAEQEESKKATAENVVTSEQIGIEDFAKVELTAATVTACEAVPKAKKLLKLTLNDGKGERTVASGIAKFYTPNELVGKTVILVSNLKPAKLCGIESQGMILAADCGEEIKVVFLDGVPAGSKIR
ncbi:MAG: methionine--tRNA ligase [Acutalibacteraceae bacterium]|nr:methionine--tRNA ligase [Acutalibacteraceae bacterium]